MLDGLRPAFRQFPLAQRGQSLNVGKHTSRLVKRTHHVLGLGQVNRRFAPDRGIHHGRHTGGNLHKGDTPQVSGRHKPRQVSNHSAAYRNDGVAPLRLQANQPIIYRLGLLEAFAGFPRRDDKAMGRDTAFLQRALHLPPVGVHNVAICQDVGRFIQSQVNQPFADGIQQPPPGYNGIASSRMMDRGRQVRVGHFVSSEASSSSLQISRARSATCSSVRPSVSNV